MILDAISEERFALIHPESSRRGHQLADLLSFPYRVTQGLRTYPQQDSLWQQGRTMPGAPCTHGGVLRPVGTCPEHPLGLVVTNAKAGYSMHNFGIPFDVVPFIDGVPDWKEKDAQWAEILEKATSCGLAEGAKWRTFPDFPHLYPQECPAEPDDNIRYLFIEGGLQAVWNELFPIPSGA
jgi:peptidoglycan L-alanyl-D-glutamate endopeptidase CwlK